MALESELSQLKAERAMEKSNMALMKAAEPNIEENNPMEMAAINMAQATISSLQRQLMNKNELVEKYRRMNEQSRVEAIKQQEIDKKEILEKSEKIDALSIELIHLRQPREFELKAEEDR